jgi:ATP-dependent DNA helicase RecG
VFGKNGKFNTEPEYPRDAWFEALVNACVHRSYNLKNMNIFVKMFDDRLEIESPGPFPPGVTPDTIYDIQHSRNPFMMEALHYLDIVKAANEGVRRIRSQMLSLNLPSPEFSQTEVSGSKVRVVLRNNIKLRRIWVDSGVSAIVGAAIAKSLSENEKLILNFVAMHGSINVSDAQRLTGTYWKAAKQMLVALQQKRLLEYHKRPARGNKDTHARWTLPAR